MDGSLDCEEAAEVWKNGTFRTVVLEECGSARTAEIQQSFREISLGGLEG